MRTLVMVGLLSVLSLAVGVPAQAGPEVQVDTEPIRAFPVRRAPDAIRMLLLMEFLQLSFENHYIATGELENNVFMKDFTVRPFHWLKAQDGSPLSARHWEHLPSSRGTYISPLDNDEFHILLIDSDGSQQRSHELRLAIQERVQSGEAGNLQSHSLAGFPREETPTHELIRWSPDPRDRAVAQWRTEALYILTEHYRLTGALPVDWREGLEFLGLSFMDYSPMPPELFSQLPKGYGKQRAGVIIETDARRSLIRISLRLAGRDKEQVEYYRVGAPAQGHTSAFPLADGASISVELGQAYPSDLDGAVFTPLVYASLRSQ